MSDVTVHDTTNAQVHQEKAAKPTKKSLKYLRDRDREMVRGIFRFYEVPGGTLSFSFRKYKEDDIENYTLQDETIYTLPRGVAHHLSNNIWYPEHQYKMDEHGKPQAMVMKKRRRCSFSPLDFMDAADLNELTPSNIDVVTILK
jgi:hypothetical protein